jgi:hypothetical protein
MIVECRVCDSTYKEIQQDQINFCKYCGVEISSKFQTEGNLGTLTETNEVRGMSTQEWRNNILFFGIPIYYVSISLARLLYLVSDQFKTSPAEIHLIPFFPPTSMIVSGVSAYILYKLIVKHRTNRVAWLEKSTRKAQNLYFVYMSFSFAWLYFTISIAAARFKPGFYGASVVATLIPFGAWVVVDYVFLTILKKYFYSQGNHPIQTAANSFGGIVTSSKDDVFLKDLPPPLPSGFQ